MDAVSSLEIFLAFMGWSHSQVTAKYDDNSAPKAVGFRFIVWLGDVLSGFGIGQVKICYLLKPIGLMLVTELPCYRNEGYLYPRVKPESYTLTILPFKCVDESIQLVTG